MGVIIPGDFKVVHIKRYFAVNVFILTRFHCIHTIPLHWGINGASEVNGAGVVNNNVDATKSVHCLFHGILQLSIIPDVHHTWQTLASCLLNCGIGSRLIKPAHCSHTHTTSSE